MLQLLQYCILRYFHCAIHQHGHASTVFTRSVLEEAPAYARVLGFLVPLLRQGSQYNKGLCYVQIVGQTLSFQDAFLPQRHKSLVILIILSLQ